MRFPFYEEEPLTFVHALEGVTPYAKSKPLSIPYWMAWRTQKLCFNCLQGSSFWTLQLNITCVFFCHLWMPNGV